MSGRGLGAGMGEAAAAAEKGARSRAGQSREPRTTARSMLSSAGPGPATRDSPAPLPPPRPAPPRHRSAPPTSARFGLARLGAALRSAARVKPAWRPWFGWNRLDPARFGQRGLAQLSSAQLGSARSRSGRFSPVQLKSGLVWCSGGASSVSITGSDCPCPCPCPYPVSALSCPYPENFVPNCRQQLGKKRKKPRNISAELVTFEGRR